MGRRDLSQGSGHGTSDARSRFKTGPNRDLKNNAGIVSQSEENDFFKLILFPKSFFPHFLKLFMQYYFNGFCCSYSKIKDGFSIDFHRLPWSKEKK